MDGMREANGESQSERSGGTYLELNHLCIYVEHNGWLSHEILKEVGFSMETLELANNLSLLAPIYREGQLGYSRLDANGEVVEAFNLGGIAQAHE